MSIIDDLGDDLARDVLAAQLELDDDRFYEKIAKEVGALSPTLQEAFLTSIRIRLAEQRGRRMLERTLARAHAGKAAKDKPATGSGA